MGTSTDKSNVTMKNWQKAHLTWLPLDIFLMSEGSQTDTVQIYKYAYLSRSSDKDIGPQKRMNGQCLWAAGPPSASTSASLAVCLYGLTVRQRALHYHWVMLITAAVAFLHKTPESHSQWGIGKIRSTRPFLLTFTTGNSSVMLSKALVSASLGFMRNNDGSKIVGKGFAFTFALGVLCVEARAE